tara:strand:- start:1426 stop:1737 length:312 start_codon:yes stop_codon:yes gene_type:complete
MTAAPSITALGWTPDGELSPEAEATHLLINRIKACIPPSSMTSEEISNQIRAKSREIAQLQDWYDSGALSAECERKNITDAIDEITEEIIQLLTSVPATEPSV